MEFIKEKFEKKLDEMTKNNSNKVKNELDAMRISAVETCKSYGNLQKLTIQKAFHCKIKIDY